MMLTWLSRASAVVLCAVAALGCYSDPEDYCRSKVESVCNTISTCCDKGTVFDMETCKLSGSQACMQQFKVDEVHAGSLVFDPGAADTCIGSINSCEDLGKASATTDDHTKACANAITGFVPAGMACSGDSDCAKDGGDFPTCYAGKVCAKVSFSGDTCGFNVDSSELRVCQHGKYCDKDKKTIDPKKPELAQQLAFTGTCKDWVAKGKSCVDTTDQTILPCADGLYCAIDPANPTTGKCAARKSEGAACQDFNSDECKEGLYCAPDQMGAGTCAATPDANGYYCYAPAVCGDGTCADNEQGTCPQDCTVCGDGFCDTGETPETCPIDCP